MRTGSSMDETSPTNRRGIDSSKPVLLFTTTSSDQVALRKNHWLCTTCRIAG